MNTTRARRGKHLLDYLPAIYQESPSSGAPSFLAEFLIPFERLLLDGDWEADDRRAREKGIDLESAPLERHVAHLHLLFNPRETPEDFLPWLAQWASLDLPVELSTYKKRELIAAILPLYRIRGTRKYLEEILRICLDATASVSDAETAPMCIGVNSRVGEDTCLGGSPPYSFRVRLLAPKLEGSALKTQCALAMRLIDLHKPAHTQYELQVISGRLQVGVCCTVGVDTSLGENEA